MICKSATQTTQIIILISIIYHPEVRLLLRVLQFINLVSANGNNVLTDDMRGVRVKVLALLLQFCSINLKIQPYHDIYMSYTISYV